MMTSTSVQALLRCGHIGGCKYFISSVSFATDSDISSLLLANLVFGWLKLQISVESGFPEKFKVMAITFNVL